MVGDQMRGQPILLGSHRDLPEKWLPTSSGVPTDEGCVHRVPKYQLPNSPRCDKTIQEPPQNDLNKHICDIELRHLIGYQRMLCDLS